MKNTRLTGGLMFKVRHVTCDKDVLVIRHEMEDKKHSEKVTVIMKHMDAYNERLDKYDELFSESNKKSKTTGAALRVWCNVRKRKADGTLPSKASDIKAFAKKLEGRECLTVREYLIDQGYAERLVDQVLEAPENALSEADADGGEGEGDATEEDAEEEPEGHEC